MGLSLKAPKGAPDILVIAGEHSGDQHAAKMISQLKRDRPELNICAIGGPELEASGVDFLFDLTKFSVVGFIEVLKQYSFFVKLLNEVVRWIAENKPKVVCLVDYPGFNLRLAQKLFEKGISQKAGGEVKVCFYVSPQIWAWKSGRRFSMAKHLDGLGVLFPFEKECYKDTDLKVDFVGHPFVEADYELPVVYDEAGEILLLPGSRKIAVERIFPVMLAAFELLLKEFPNETAVVLYPTEAIKLILEKQIVDRLKSKVKLVPIEERVGAKAVLGSSGTMSLNCALAGIPGAIIYKLNPVTYMFAKFFAKIKFIGIANILLNRAIYKEYIQSAAEESVLAEELKDCIGNKERRQKQVENAIDLKRVLTQEERLSASSWLAGWL